MNTHTQHQRPVPEHGQAKRARGLDPEITAQPRPIPDDIDLELDGEAALSIDPEDLGSHFLSEAIEQGDFNARRATERETALFEPTVLEALDETERPDRDDEVEQEIRQALRQLAEGRVRKASRRAPAKPKSAPVTAKAAGRARTVLLMVARTLRHFAQRLQLRAAVVPMPERGEGKDRVHDAQADDGG